MKHWCKIISTCRPRNSQKNIQFDKIIKLNSDITNLQIKLENNNDLNEDYNNWIYVDYNIFIC